MEAVYIISAAVINTIFNGLWAIFFQRKCKKICKLPDRVTSADGPMPYLISFIGSLWGSYGLFLIIKHIQPKAIDELLTIAIGAWLLILVSMSAKHYAFEGRKMSELFIDYSQDCISFILISYILWGVY